MQSEIGAAGAVHGPQRWGLTTTLQLPGFALMVPNLYKIAGELLPCVIHVSARLLPPRPINLWRSSGCDGLPPDRRLCWLQQCPGSDGFGPSLTWQPLRLVYPSPLFDGFRTSHEFQKIETVEYSQMAELSIWKQWTDSPEGHEPRTSFYKGTAQNPDIYFQGREVANPYYDAVPKIVQDYMDRFAGLTGRRYQLFDYYGDPRRSRLWWPWALCAIPLRAPWTICGAGT